MERIKIEGNEPFFFVQAEDGIGDATVTGVQTCALPIWPPPWETAPLPRRGPARFVARLAVNQIGRASVGKEGRSRWSPDHLKKKKKKTRERRTGVPRTARAVQSAQSTRVT